jgi:hypothetical protein
MGSVLQHEPYVVPIMLNVLLRIESENMEIVIGTRHMQEAALGIGTSGPLEPLIFLRPPFHILHFLPVCHPSEDS